MTPEEIDHRYHACVRIARSAGDLAKSYFNDLGSLKIEAKGVHDLVSAADRDVEAFIKRSITTQFPTDQCIGEESGGASGGASWVIDPIDGTGNFLRGVAHYCVSIAFVAGDQVEVGAIYDPSLDELFAAKRGAGATLNGRSIRTRSTIKLEEALVCVGFSSQSPLEAFLSGFRSLLDRNVDFRRIGSAALGLANVAAGRFDAFWQLHLHAWDVLAGMLLVQEAGGWMNDFLAGGGLENGNFTLACAAGVKDELIALLPAPSQSSDKSP